MCEIIIISLMAVMLARPEGTRASKALGGKAKALGCRRRPRTWASRAKILSWRPRPGPKIPVLWCKKVCNRSWQIPEDSGPLFQRAAIPKIHQSPVQRSIVTLTLTLSEQQTFGITALQNGWPTGKTVSSILKRRQVHVTEHYRSKH